MDTPFSWCCLRSILFSLLRLATQPGASKLLTVPVVRAECGFYYRVWLILCTCIYYCYFLEGKRLVALVAAEEAFFQAIGEKASES